MSDSRYLRIPRTKIRGLANYLEAQRNELQRSFQVDGAVTDPLIAAEINLVDGFITALRNAQRRLKI